MDKLHALLAEVKRARDRRDRFDKREFAYILAAAPYDAACDAVRAHVEELIRNV